MDLALAAPIPVVLLWAGTYPGNSLGLFALAALWALLIGTAWLVRLLGWVVRRRRPGPGLQWLVMPAMGLLTIGALYISVTWLPLEIRFSFAVDHFDAVVANLEPAGTDDRAVTLEVPGRIGGYGVDDAFRLGEAVIFSTSSDAGFAHLPSGPSSVELPATSTAPTFRHVTGDWYAWTGNW